MSSSDSVQFRLARHLGQTPDTAQALFVAANATVVGDVVLGPSSSVFYGAVLRGDIQEIRVGEGSNIQDNAVVHLAEQFAFDVGVALDLREQLLAFLLFQEALGHVG